MHVLGISFLALYLAHLVTDFVLQSKADGHWKETRVGSGLLGV